jgi:hypothetical protein
MYFEFLILLRASLAQPVCLPAIQALAHALNQITLMQVYSLQLLCTTRPAELYLNSILRPKRGRAAAEASPPTLPLTVAWMLRPNQGQDTLGRVLGEMRISTAKKQVLQSMAGAFPCNAVLHKWGIAPSAACSLC